MLWHEWMAGEQVLTKPHEAVKNLTAFPHSAHGCSFPRVERDCGGALAIIFNEPPNTGVFLMNLFKTTIAGICTNNKVSELQLSYHNPKTILFAIYPYYMVTKSKFLYQPPRSTHTAQVTAGILDSLLRQRPRSLPHETPSTAQICQQPSFKECSLNHNTV